MQRLRLHNKQLTSQDLSELEGMLHDAGAGPADLVWASHQPGGLGLFIESLVGLERSAAEEAFTDFLGGRAGYSLNQVRFVDPLIVKELTAQGAMEPGRLFESLFTDVAATGPDALFADDEVGKIVDILGAVGHGGGSCDKQEALGLQLGRLLVENLGEARGHERERLLERLRAEPGLAALGVGRRRRSPFSTDVLRGLAAVVRRVLVRRAPDSAVRRDPRPSSSSWFMRSGSISRIRSFRESFNTHR